MNKAFREKLVLDYDIDHYWIKIIEIINVNAKLIINGENAELFFIYNIDSNLIFHKNKFINFERLYISRLLIKDILEITYNNDYQDFKKTFDIVFKL